MGGDRWQFHPVNTDTQRGMIRHAHIYSRNVKREIKNGITDKQQLDKAKKRNRKLLMYFPARGSGGYVYACTYPWESASLETVVQIQQTLLTNLLDRLRQHIARQKKRVSVSHAEDGSVKKRTDEGRVVVVVVVDEEDE